MSGRQFSTLLAAEVCVSVCSRFTAHKTWRVFFCVGIVRNRLNPFGVFTSFPFRRAELCHHIIIELFESFPREHRMKQLIGTQCVLACYHWILAAGAALIVAGGFNFGPFRSNVAVFRVQDLY
jgi:hypothetical protein